MTTLIVGFDSAWTATNSGAIVGVLRSNDGALEELGPPQIADYAQAESVITDWQARFSPAATIVLLDQPTIVKNTRGQRPVENIVGSLVALRYGGMQPANTGKAEMFGAEAPVWPFLTRLGGAANPLAPSTDTLVFETYPVFAMIALGWTLPDSRPAGRLPKYNPERRKTFTIGDWRYVCARSAAALRERRLLRIPEWLDTVASITPRKSDQDGVDACLCLLIGLFLIDLNDCLMVGDLETGYIVVPHEVGLRGELDVRCRQTARVPSEWVRVFRLGGAS